MVTQYQKPNFPKRSPETVQIPPLFFPPSGTLPAIIHICEFPEGPLLLLLVLYHPNGRRNLLRLPGLLPLAVGLGSVVALVDDEVLGPVVVAAAEVRVEDGLGAGRVAGLGVERGAGHVGDGGVSGGAAPVLVGGGAEGVVLGGGLGEPDVTAVAAELAGGEGFGDVLFDDDGAAGGVDEP